MQFYEINICRIMTFNLYNADKKNADDKNWPPSQIKVASIIASARKILLLTVVKTVSAFLLTLLNQGLQLRFCP